MYNVCIAGRFAYTLLALCLHFACTTPGGESCCCLLCGRRVSRRHGHYLCSEKCAWNYKIPLMEAAKLDPGIILTLPIDNFFSTQE